MKDDIQLIEYFTEKGWSLNPKQLQLMVASYNLGINDALSETNEVEKWKTP